MLLWFLLVEHLIYIRLQNWAKTNSEMFVLFLKFLRSWVVAKQSKSFGQIEIGSEDLLRLEGGGFESCKNSRVICLECCLFTNDKNTREYYGAMIVAYLPSV